MPGGTMKENNLKNNDNNKGTVKKLKLTKETISILKVSELKRVVGGTNPGNDPTMPTSNRITC
jgi:natural product precursor